MTRYWFNTQSGRGVGVTAYDYDDAVAMVTEEEFIMGMSPNFDNYIESVDIRTLDQNHVIPNMGVCSIRGIWFPNLT